MLNLPGELVHVMLVFAAWVIAVPSTLACLYLFILTILSSALRLPSLSNRGLRFDLIVPAHNEETTLNRVLASLHRIDWPSDQFRTIVIADNCNDRTAAIASAAGAQVLERFDPQRRGKGYALAFAFEQSCAHGWANAVVVIDADAEVSPNLLEAIARRLERGDQAVQVHYGVLNIHASWRTRLMTIAKASFHLIRSRARERLKLSCGIRGNGWAVTPAVLRQVPYRAFSLTEDIEYGIALGLAGYRVAYADEAHADAEMVANEGDARKQRQRWERGRFGLISAWTLPLLGSALRKRSLVCLDLALDLLVLPLSYVALGVALLLLLGSIALLTNDGSSEIWIWMGAGCLGALTLYILRGWQLSGVGWRGLIDLARAPLFLLWKIFVMLGAQRTDEWVRTKRESLEGKPDVNE